MAAKNIKEAAKAAKAAAEKALALTKEAKESNDAAIRKEAAKAQKEAKAAAELYYSLQNEAAKEEEAEVAAPIKEERKMNYQSMNINDIINWCKENNQVDWLKATMETKVPYKQYPRKKVIKLDENGNVVVNAKGKVQFTTVADKSKAPKTVMRKPNFMHIKNAFVEKFMADLKPVAKPKKPTMYDVISNL
jgi:hypothetical protein